MEVEEIRWMWFTNKVGTRTCAWCGEKLHVGEKVGTRTCAWCGEKLHVGEDVLSRIARFTREGRSQEYIKIYHGRCIPLLLGWIEKKFQNVVCYGPWPEEARAKHGR